MTTRLASLAFILAALGAASCSDDDDSPALPNNGATPVVIQTTGADGKTGYLSTVANIAPGVAQSNAAGFEVAGFSYPYVHKNQIIVTQNLSADTVLSFTVGADGQLTQGPSFEAPPSSFCDDVIWASDTQAFLTLADAGKVIDLNPQTMVKNRELDLTGAAAVVGFEDAASGDVNPNPTQMVIRDGKLFVALWQTKAEFVARDGVSVAVVDLASWTVDKYITDMRGLTAAGRSGEPDSMFVDEQGDIYLYCSGGFSLNPVQHHGFLRIKKGSTDFDPDYFFDMTAEETTLPSKHSDFCNSMRYYKGGRWFCAIDDNSLYSNPPDPIGDYGMTVASVDLYNKKTTILAVPFTNQTAGGALEIENDTLYMSLATKDNGAGIFTYDIVKSVVSSGPVVTTQGYANLIRRVRP